MTYLLAQQTHVIEHDHEAIHAAYQVADYALEGRNQRDQARQLPIEEVQLFSEKGLGGIRIPKRFGGPRYLIKL